MTSGNKIVFTLLVYDLKRVKLGLSSFNYYLKATFEDSEPVISPFKNLILEELVLEINDVERL